MSALIGSSYLRSLPHSFHLKTIIIKRIDRWFAAVLFPSCISDFWSRPWLELAFSFDRQTAFGTVDSGRYHDGARCDAAVVPGIKKSGIRAFSAKCSCERSKIQTFHESKTDFFHRSVVVWSSFGFCFVHILYILCSSYFTLNIQLQAFVRLFWCSVCMSLVRFISSLKDLPIRVLHLRRDDGCLTNVRSWLLRLVMLKPTVHM